MQSDAEHQQDHADFGELARETRVGDEARREGADRDTRDQVSDDRRHLEQVGPQPEQQCKHETDGEQGYERSFVQFRGHTSEVNPIRIVCGRSP
jgi:hypothetical protein